MKMMAFVNCLSPPILRNIPRSHSNILTTKIDQFSQQIPSPQDVTLPIYQFCHIVNGGNKGKNIHMVKHAEDKAFSFIDEISGLKDREAIFDTLFSYVQYFGFNSFLMVNVPSPNESLAQNVITNRWPSGWYRRYIENNYFSVDAIAQNLRQSVEPYFWSDVSLKDDEPSKLISHEAREFHLIDGCCVPIYSKDGFLSAITYGSDSLDISKKELAAIYLMSIYAFNSSFKKQSGGGGKFGTQRHRLSPREKECILWVSRGKTSWEIGEILSIAKSTVDEYVISVCKKTDSVTRAQAVAECIRRKEIKI